MPVGPTSERDFDPAGQSLANLSEVVIACLDAIGATSVVEVGAHRGELTAVLLDWAEGAGARVSAVEPAPAAELEALARERTGLELVRDTSHEALGHLPLPDAIVLDGDHNHYTLTGELRLITERADEPPLLLLHDVCWPHARRDTYYAPDRIPAEHRRPLAERAAVAPGERGLAPAGLRYGWVAREEGGPENGVLTAIEDFMREREGLRLAIVPAFFGLGVLWSSRAPWSDALAAAIAPWDRNPVLERLEEHRLANLVESARNAQELGEIEIMRRERERDAERERLLRSMLDSRAFAWGERLSRLRKGGRPTFSREQVRRALDED
jgi:Methyltransferase domain